MQLLPERHLEGVHVRSILRPVEDQAILALVLPGLQKGAETGSNDCRGRDDPMTPAFSEPSEKKNENVVGARLGAIEQREMGRLTDFASLDRALICTSKYDFGPCRMMQSMP